jgi:hypothetical protein
MKKKLNGFKTPEDYFDSFTDNLMTKLSEELTIEKKVDGFTIPDTYFDSLYQNIQNKTHTPESKVIKLNALKKYYYVAAVAAVVLIFIGISLTNKTEITFDDIAISDIENYFDDNELDMSTYELAQMLPIDELEIKDIIDTQLNDENIIDYIDNSIDNFEELNLDTNE